MVHPHNFHTFQPNQGFVPTQTPMQMEPMQLPPQQTPPNMDLGAASFKMDAVSEFIPKGKMVNTADQFPDALADLDDEPKKKKAGGGKKGKKKTTVVVAAKKDTDFEDVDESVPWKGKKSEFFLLKKSETPLNDPMNPENFELNNDQWNFIFKFYPEHGGSPYNMMVWLYG